MIRVFIGYDERQPISYTALCKSIIDNCSEPVSITPIVLRTLPVRRAGLTPFTYSRFLVPWLCGYEGHALFLDIDMMVRGDLAQLWAQKDRNFSIQVCKNVRKFERASLMLFDCAKCDILTPEYVTEANDLHSIGFLPDSFVGDIPSEWNHLVGYDAPRDDAKLVHFTQGVPIFPETKDSEYGDEWRRYAQESVGTQSWQQLMGHSVHAAPVLNRFNNSNGSAHASPPQGD